MLGGGGLFLLCGCDSPVPPVARVATGHVASGADSTDEIAPSDIRVHAGSAWVVDKASERIVRMDAALRWRGQFGRPGSGPGEFRGALRIRVRNGIVAVSEIGNGRVSLFDTAGVFLGARRISMPQGSFDLDAHGEIVAVIRSETHYLERITSEGQRSLLARRSPSSVRRARRGPDGRLRFLGADLVATIGGDSLVVLDNLSGELFLIGPSGDQARRILLPHEVVERMRVHRDDRVKRVESTGRTVWTAPLAKDMWWVEGGTLAILSAAKGAELLLVSLSDGRTSIAQLGSPGEQELLRTAMAAAVMRNEVMIVGDSGTTRHHFTLRSAAR